MTEENWNRRLSSFSRPIPASDLSRVLAKDVMNDYSYYKIVILIPCTQLSKHAIVSDLNEIKEMPKLLIDRSHDKQLASITVIVDCSYSDINSLLPEGSEKCFDVKYDNKGELSNALGMRQGNKMLRGHLIFDKKCRLKNLAASIINATHTVEEIARLVQALNHSDKWGQVCQAGWSLGEEGIVPDPKESREFFDSWAKQH